VTNAVYCLCSSEPRANAILTHLRNEGFKSSEISVLLQRTDTRDISLKEDAVRGAKIGSVVGALLALTVPGIGAVVALGPLLAALGGATAGGVVGGLVGGAGALNLKPLGLPEEIAQRLENGVTKGAILIVVHTDDLNRLRTAEGFFKSEGADQIYLHEEKAA